MKIYFKYNLLIKKCNKVQLALKSYLKEYKNKNSNMNINLFRGSK